MPALSGAGRDVRTRRCRQGVVRQVRTRIRRHTPSYHDEFQGRFEAMSPCWTRAPEWGATSTISGPFQSTTRAR